MKHVQEIAIAIATMLLLVACRQDEAVAPPPAMAGTSTPEVIQATPRGGVFIPSAGTPIPRGLIIAPTPTPYKGVFLPRAASTLPRLSTPSPASADCGSFAAADLAQAYFLNEGGPFMDPHELDTNGDGIACNGPSDAGFSARQWAEGPSVVVSPTSSAKLLTPSATASPTLLNAPSPHPQADVGEAEKEATATPEPLELWEVDWAYLEEEGLVDIVAHGERLAWSDYIGPDGQAPPRSCVIEVGTSADESNPTWMPDERKAWIWVDPPEEGDAFCVGASWSTKQRVFPIPVYLAKYGSDRAALSRQRAAGIGASLVFPSDYEITEYTLPPEPPHFAGAPRYSGQPDPLPALDTSAFAAPTLEVDVSTGKVAMYCTPEMLPVAIWTSSEGFIPLTMHEEKRYGELATDYDFISELELTESDLETREEARKLGWYFVLGNEGDNPAYCWRVGNHEDIRFDIRPCLECYKRN